MQHTIRNRRWLRFVSSDKNLGEVIKSLKERGVYDKTDIMVVSDHGFSTHTGELKLDALVAPFARPMPDGSRDIVVAEGAIYLRANRDAARVAAIVAALQRRPEVGAMFTRPSARGTSAFANPISSVTLPAPRKAPILLMRVARSPTAVKARVAESASSG